MIIKLYKSNVSIGIVLIPLFALIFSSSVFFNNINEKVYPFAWEVLFLNWIQGHLLINFISSFILLCLNSILIFQVFSRINFFSKTTYVPSLLYFGFLSFAEFSGFDFSLIIDTILLLLIDQLIKIDKNKVGIHVAFRSGLLIGLAVCLVPSNLLLVLLVLIALNLIKTFVGREWILVGLGSLIPVLFAMFIQFVLIDQFVLVPNFSSFEWQWELEYLDYVKIGLLFLFIIVGLGPLKSFFTHNTALIKNRMSILLYMLLILILVSCISFFFFGETNRGLIVPLALCYSVSSVTIKSDNFISLLMTIILILNITFLFL